MLLKSYVKGRNNQALGLSLLELVFVVTIISLLTSLVYPIYAKHILESHRKTAMMDLMSIQLLLEQTYQDGYQSSGIFDEGRCLVCGSDPTRYSISLDLTSPYTIKATSLNAQRQDSDCQTLSVNQLGQLSPASCW